MKYIPVNNTDLSVSEIALGCMRIASKSESQVSDLIHTALDEGINLFDHADIYGGGRSEVLFGEVLKKEPSLREKMILQSKHALNRASAMMLPRITSSLPQMVS